MSTAIDVNRQLLDCAERLVEEYPDHPAGSVLRCFARAVRLARARGVTVAALPAVAEIRARAMLNGVPVTDGRHRSLARASVPA